MEPENTSLGKRKIIFVTSIFRFYLNPRRCIPTWKVDGATPIVLSLPLTNRHLLGVASHLLSLQCIGIFGRLLFKVGPYYS